MAFLNKTPELMFLKLKGNELKIKAPRNEMILRLWDSMEQIMCLWDSDQPRLL